MKVLALVTDAFGGYGGIAQYNRDFLTAMSQMHDVNAIYVLPRIAPDHISRRIPHKVAQYKPVSNRAAYSARALQLCLTLRPDVIFSGHLYHGPLAALLAKVSGARLISQLHGTEIWEPLDRRHMKPLEASGLVLCVSRDTQTRYLAQASRLKDNALVLHNTVRQQFSLGDRQQARRGLGLDNEFVILTVARLDGRDGYKGHDRIIRLLPSLAAQDREVVYLIAGSGEDRGRLEALAHTLDVSRKVKFLDVVGDDDLPALYRAADLFALPSTGEGFGIVFLEAMASGTPAIGLAVGGATDALVCAPWGLAVSPEAFEEQITSLVQRCCSITDEERLALSKKVERRFGKDSFVVALQRSISFISPGPLDTPSRS